MVQRNTEDLFRRVNSLIPDAIKASAYFDAQAKLMSSKLLDHSAASRAQDCGIPAILEHWRKSEWTWGHMLHIPAYVGADFMN